MSSSESSPYVNQRIKESDENADNQWGNKCQFILSAVGLAVGLGNVWRFPGLAYENGGSAFLIPYITSGFVFGLPVIYAEFIMGQYTQTNPAKAFYLYAPAFHGLGLAAVLTCIFVAIFYAVVIGWAMLYLGLTIGGQSYKWTRCDNDWNTDNCIPSANNLACYNANSSLPYAFNGTCVSESPSDAMSGAEEFFINYVTKRSSGIDEVGHLNYPVAICLVVLYVLCAVTNLKGVKILGKLSYFTVPLPYIVAITLSIRGMFLDGAMDGVKLYLFEPDMSKLLNFNTWVTAVQQTCFSLALGQGALISLASHNKKRNNCFRDALTVIVFDTLMSVLGGLAVFSILGYLAKLSGKDITKIVESGPSLVFIVYPEAIATMPLPWIWNLLLFAMLVLLGFSTQVVMIELCCGFVTTSFSSIKTKWIMPILFSVLLCLSAMLIATESGWYWFLLMADFAATTCPFLVIALELVLFYVYGWKNLSRDLEDLFGPKPKNLFFLLFSRQSPYFFLCWGLICPILGLLCCVFTLNRNVPMPIGDDVLPIWAEAIGWFFNLGPLLAIPVCFCIQWYRLKRKGRSMVHLFRPAEEHPSHDRIFRQEDIETPKGFNNEVESSTETSSNVSVLDELYNT